MKRESSLARGSVRHRMARTLRPSAQTDRRAGVGYSQREAVKGLEEEEEELRVHGGKDPPRI